MKGGDRDIESGEPVSSYMARRKRTFKHERGLKGMSSLFIYVPVFECESLVFK